MTPFDGTLVWIWTIAECDGGNIPAIVTRLQGVGAAGALIKDSDAGHTYNDPAQVKALVAALKAAGLKAITWGYCYDYSEPSEAAAQLAAIANADPDGRVLDVEQEEETQPTAPADATAMIAAIRTAYPSLPLGYSPVSNIRGHLKVPYRQFTDAGCAMLPQAYYTGYGWTVDKTLTQFYADVAQHDLAQQPIYPAYEDAPSAKAGSTDADVLAFCLATKAAGATGTSVWSYQHLDAAGWQRVAAAVSVFPANATPPPGPTRLPTNDDNIEMIRLVLSPDLPGLIAYAEQFVPDPASAQIADLRDQLSAIEATAANRATLLAAAVHQAQALISSAAAQGVT